MSIYIKQNDTMYKFVIKDRVLYLLKYIKQTDTTYKFVDKKFITIKYSTILKQYEEEQLNKYY